jgi:hypothetical protein
MLVSLTETRKRLLPAVYYPIRNPLRPAPETLVTLVQPQTNGRRHPYGSRFSGEPKCGKFPTPDRDGTFFQPRSGDRVEPRKPVAGDSNLDQPGENNTSDTHSRVPASFLSLPTRGITSTPPISAAHPRTALCGTRCDLPPATPPARSSAHRPTESVQTNQSSGS